MTRVEISSRDEILGAIVRALAVQVAGFQMAGGKSGASLMAHGYYDFDFSPSQVHKFETLVHDYVSENLRRQIKILPSN